MAGGSLPGAFAVCGIAFPDTKDTRAALSSVYVRLREGRPCDLRKPEAMDEGSADFLLREASDESFEWAREEMAKVGVRLRPRTELSPSQRVEEAWESAQREAAVERETGWVHEPASGVFHEVVAPGQSIQAAIDRCPAGGFILLQPGSHKLVVYLRIEREVHIFGRGSARLAVLNCGGIVSRAPAATVDGVLVERARGKLEKIYGLTLGRGRVRLQNVVITGAFRCGILVTHGADPVIVDCRIVDVGGAGVAFVAPGTRGTLLTSVISNTGGMCVSITDGAEPRVVSNKVHDGRKEGFLVDGGRGRLVGNDIWGHANECVLIEGGSDVSVLANKIHDGLAYGVSAQRNKEDDSPRVLLKNNRIQRHRGYGVAILEGLTSVEVVDNIICDGFSAGIVIADASARVVGNDIFGNVISNLTVQSLHRRHQAAPVVCDNLIHDLKWKASTPCFSAGLRITGEAMQGRFERNQVFRNAWANIAICDGADPLLTDNVVYGASRWGVYISDGSKGVLKRNDIWGNREIEVVILSGADPVLEDNRIHDGAQGVSVSHRRTGGRLRGNDIFNFSSACVSVTESLSFEAVDNRIHAGTHRTTGVLISGGSRCTLRDNEMWRHTTGISTSGGTSDPLIEHNALRECVVGVEFKGATAGRLLRNDIGACSWGVLVEADGDPLVSGNAVHDCKWGISSTQGSLEGNAVWHNDSAGMSVGGRPRSLKGNLVCGNATAGIVFLCPGADDVLVGAGNVLAQNTVSLAPNQPPRGPGFYDRALCSHCRAEGASKLCSRCKPHGAPFRTRYCGAACQKADWVAHKPYCERALARADEWVHALDALLDLPDCPYGDLEVLAQRRSQRKLEAESRPA